MRKLLTIVTAILVSTNLFAQTPQKMSYQAVIRNSSNALVLSTDIGMQISILKGSANGTNVYTETQTPATNANGLVTVQIGNGIVTKGIFGDIDWSGGPYFIKTETDITGGTNYNITATTQLLSVPYALYAEKSGTPGPKGDTGPKGDAGANGDRYTTTSSTSFTIGLGSKNLTVGTGLNYAVGQTVIIANTLSNLMMGSVVSYNSSNGAMAVTVTSVSGSGTFSSWSVSLNGAAGPQGPIGATGADGATWLTGTIAPTKNDGKINDLFMNTTSGEYFLKTSNTAWTKQGNLTGPKGDAGVAGTNGANGVIWTIGTKVPLNSFGSINDFFLQTTTGDYYQKTSGGWAKQGNLKGPSGSTSISGTENQLIKFTGTNTGGDSQVFDDGTNVGIGTVTPSQTLDVAGTIQSSKVLIVDGEQKNDGGITGNNCLLFGGIASGEGIGSKRTQNGNIYGLDLYTASTNRLTITRYGNIGIGTNNPTSLLSITKNGVELTGAAASNTLRTNAGYLIAGEGSNLKLANFGFQSDNQTSLGIMAYRHSFGNDWTTSSIVVGIDVDNTSQAGGYVTFSGSGNVGVNSKSPTSALTVNGTFAAATAYVKAGGTPLALGTGVPVPNAHFITTSGAPTTRLMLPNAVSCPGREYVLYNISNDALFIIVIESTGCAFFGSGNNNPSTPDFILGARYMVRVISDGTNWFYGIY